MRLTFMFVFFVLEKRVRSCMNIYNYYFNRGIK
jgi:hypothetical protein